MRFCSEESRGRIAMVDRPRRVPAAAASAFELHERIGRQVLHCLERSRPARRTAAARRRSQPTSSRAPRMTPTMSAATIVNASARTLDQRSGGIAVPRSPISTAAAVASTATSVRVRSSPASGAGGSATATSCRSVPDVSMASPCVAPAASNATMSSPSSPRPVQSRLSMGANRNSPPATPSRISVAPAAVSSSGTIRACPTTGAVDSVRPNSSTTSAASTPLASIPDSSGDRSAGPRARPVGSTVPSRRFRARPRPESPGRQQGGKRSRAADAGRRSGSRPWMSNDTRNVRLCDSGEIHCSLHGRHLELHAVLAGDLRGSVPRLPATPGRSTCLSRPRRSLVGPLPLR